MMDVECNITFCFTFGDSILYDSLKLLHSIISAEQLWYIWKVHFPLEYKSVVVELIFLQHLHPVYSYCNKLCDFLTYVIKPIVLVANGIVPCLTVYVRGH